MSLLHIGLALGLSAAAALLVTGAAMRPLQPDCPVIETTACGTNGKTPGNSGSAPAYFPNRGGRAAENPMANL
jgi:hypothetical protein